MLYVFIGILVVIVLVIIANIRIVPQSFAFVIERLGAYATTWHTGLHVKVPFILRSRFLPAIPFDTLPKHQECHIRIDSYLVSYSDLQNE